MMLRRARKPTMDPLMMSLMRGRHRAKLCTLSGCSFELAEALERRRVDLCAVQEKSPRTTSGVRIIVGERFRDAITSMERFNDRLMKVVIAAERRLYHLFSAYAPQTGCSERAKNEFWSPHDEKTAEVPSQNVILVSDELNEHVGPAKDGDGCHGGLGFGSRNADGERILEYAESHDLTIMNTRFRKRVKQEIRDMYELEVMSISTDEYRKDDTAYDYLNSYAKRITIDDGNITAPFPLKDNVVELDTNFNVAASRFIAPFKFQKTYLDQKRWHT
ncbi:unnamed protein product [Heligmosomoides polygyrus]|uniref:Endo/exonuclease/phosphatase domain-containing protein n=1 Tax=Heligmosomoides polygyrus TaxID=6339 RepID=A0A183G3J8_HELPZ|nr:unnamed protein product [Heligmosomoides polygyrus]